MKRKEKLVSWEQVIKMTCSLSQEDLESFWDELVFLTDPRREYIPMWAVEKALRAARGAEAGQGVIEYIAILALVAIVLFLLATWLFDAGVVESLRSTLHGMLP